MSKRITVSTSKPATKLRKIASQLSDGEFFLLQIVLHAGARVLVFRVDENGKHRLIDDDSQDRLEPAWKSMWTGERVSLAETEVAMPISGA